MKWAKKQANAFGLHDMHGNASEWCQDVYVNKLVGGTNPIVENGGSDRVSRGGSWNVPAFLCRSARRSHSPDVRANRLSFRVSLVPANE